MFADMLQTQTDDSLTRLWPGSILPTTPRGTWLARRNLPVRSNGVAASDHPKGERAVGHAGRKRQPPSEMLKERHNTIPLIP